MNGPTLLRMLARRPWIVSRGPSEGRSLALTFDDGPSEWTAEILDLFRAHGGRATFFVLGASVAGREAILRRAVEDGHELGNHAYSHRDPATLSAAELRGELRKTSELIARAAGAQPRLFRPPYAGHDRRVARIAAAEGLRPTVLRSVDPADWRTTDAKAIVDEVLGAAAPGAIVCLHDGVPPNNSGSSTRRPTVEALATLIPALRAARFELSTASELLG